MAMKVKKNGKRIINTINQYVSTQTLILTPIVTKMMMMMMMTMSSSKFLRFITEQTRIIMHLMLIVKMEVNSREPNLQIDYLNGIIMGMIICNEARSLLHYKMMKRKRLYLCLT